MMKRIFLLLACILTLSALRAQLLDGSICPNFTGTDLNGNSWNLYSVLDQGKMVVIDISATWCSPCWEYHQSGQLESFYAQYGPSGTNEVMVFLIEGDPSTSLADLQGTGSHTKGDWVTGTDYPIINSASIATLLERNYYPTFYAICPNRKVQLIEASTAAELYALYNNCSVSEGTNNATIMAYTGLSGSFCGEQTFTPSFFIQNLGTAPLISATCELWLNGVLTETQNWTGNLATFNFKKVSFTTTTLSANTQIEIRVKDVNNTTDDMPSDNQSVNEFYIAAATSDNKLKLELLLDNAPANLYWELVNSDNKVLYSGGNPQVNSPNTWQWGAYREPNATINVDIPVPKDDCYRFKITDRAHDGLCCQGNGEGYYKITNSAGTILASGGAFADYDERPIRISGCTEIKTNARFLPPYISGEQYSFCYNLAHFPFAKVLNLGTDTIKTLDYKSNYPPYNFHWTGEIPPLAFAPIELDGLLVSESTDLEYTIKRVNNVFEIHKTDDIQTDHLRYYPTSNPEWKLDIQTDGKGYELFWYVETSFLPNVTITSGGNTNVGANGGNKKNAQPGDPGAYENFAHIQVPISLPEGACYNIVLVDDGGDGMLAKDSIHPAPKVKLLDKHNHLIADISDGYYFEQGGVSIDAHYAVVATHETPDMHAVQLSPNPAGQQSILSFQLSAASKVNVQLSDMHGRLVWANTSAVFNAGDNQIVIPTAALTAGMYLVKIESGEGTVVKKLVVEKS